MQEPPGGYPVYIHVLPTDLLISSVNHFYQDKETGRQFILKIKDIYEGWAIKAYQEQFTPRQYIKFLYAKFTAVFEHFKDGDLDEKISGDAIYDFLKKEIN